MLRDHWREFPRELGSIDEIPAGLRESLDPYLIPQEDLIHTYLIPQPRGFWDWFHDAPPKNSVFVLTPNEVAIARERPDGSVGVEHCSMNDLLSVEVGTILLTSWLKLTVADSEATEEFRLEYGTVFERSFRDSILWLRALTGQACETPPRHQWRMPGEDFIKSLPIKFNNAARSYWIEGERALTTCFINPLSVPVRFFSRFRRNYACATAIVVSDRDVCVITEQAMSGAGRWGQSWRFCPLCKIADIAVVEAEPFPRLHLSLCVARERTATTASRPRCEVDVPFDPAQRGEIEALIALVEGIPTVGGRLAGRVKADRLNPR